MLAEIVMNAKVAFVATPIIAIMPLVVAEVIGREPASPTQATQTGSYIPMGLECSVSKAYSWGVARKAMASSPSGPIGSISGSLVSVTQYTEWTRLLVHLKRKCSMRSLDSLRAVAHPCRGQSCPPHTKSKKESRNSLAPLMLHVGPITSFFCLMANPTAVKEPTTEVRVVVPGVLFINLSVNIDHRLRPSFSMRSPT